LARADESYPIFPATYLAHVGEYGQAMSWLEAALAWGFSNHRFWAEHNRFLAPLRGDPRFGALIDRAKEKQRDFELSQG
jgi:hypothetical protein